MELFTFIIVSLGIIVIPGPNVLVVVSTSISAGKIKGLQTVAGTSIAMAIQMGVAILGTTWFVAGLAKGFMLLKWIGVAYLIYLGASHLYKYCLNPPEVATPSRTSSFQRGFWVSLTNPKTILFFSAFLPQFVNMDSSYLVQISILSAVFLTMAVVLDSAYALLAGHFSNYLNNKKLNRYRHGISGLIFIGAGVTLATTKNLS